MSAMDPMDYIWEKFSEDYTIETVRHLLMAHFDLSEEEAQAKIDEYFRIVDLTTSKNSCRSSGST